jgi:hypothetical protein
MSKTGSEKDTWSEFGYASPHNGPEYRVAEIANTYESLTTDGLKAVRKELKKLMEDGKLRIGYQDWARRLRLRIKKFLPPSDEPNAGG